MDLILFTLLTGLVLSMMAAFRWFAPLLIASLAARTGYLNLGSGFTWIASDLAVIVMAIALALELWFVYRYPTWRFYWVGTISIGVLLTAASVLGFGALGQWGIGAITGGGISALSSKFAFQKHSDDPLLAVVVRTTIAIIVSILAIVMPLIGLCIALIGVGLGARVGRFNHT